MIKGLFFLFVVIAVLWLAVWSVRAERGKSGRWTPFDMRNSEPARRSGIAAQRSRRSRQSRARARR